MSSKSSKSRLIAWTLILVGLTIAGVGIALVLVEISSMYKHVLDDALATPEIDEQARSGRMLMRLGLGALGLPLVLAGKLMRHRDRIRRQHARNAR